MAEAMVPDPARGARRTPAAVGAAVAGMLVLGAATVWGALEVAVALALEGATTAGAAYAVVRARRWRRSTRMKHLSR
jgi:hypothetical protein